MDRKLSEVPMNPTGSFAPEPPGSAGVPPTQRLGLKSRLVLLGSPLVLLLVGLALQPPALSQTRQAPRKRPPEELLRLSIAAETPGLAEPFKGITTNGQIEQGLFAIRSTGVSTAPVRKAAETFLASLTKTQREKTMFPVDDPEWRKWMNQSFYVRQGVSFLEMNGAQRDAAFGLLRAGLSAKGLKQTRDIMRLNETLAELNDDNFDEYGEWRYYVTVMGKPSATEPWGWQFDGHHAIINYFVLGDQVVMTPFFAGSEPVHATIRQVPGDVRPAGRAECRARDDQRARRVAARKGRPQALQDRRRQSHRGVEGQRGARLRRHSGNRPVGARSARSSSI